MNTTNNIVKILLYGNILLWSLQIALNDQRVSLVITIILIVIAIFTIVLTVVKLFRKGSISVLNGILFVYSIIFVLLVLSFFTFLGAD